MPPLNVSFTDSSTGNPTSYTWDFDNGNTPTHIPNPSAVYTSPGVYNVLHAVSNGATSDTEYILIRVFAPPLVNFGAPDNLGCIEPCHLVHFVNQTIPGESPVMTYVWDFGDGSVAVPGVTVTHCYDSIGSFNVTLVARDSNGCQVNKIVPNYVVIGSHPTGTAVVAPNQACVQPYLFSFTGTGSSPNGTVNFEWHFIEGGATSTLQNPKQVFFNGIWNPYLIVIDTLGCQDTIYTHLEVTDLVAGFTASTVNACQGIAMQFTDTSNFALKWLWNFGDGPYDTSTRQNPTHTYTTNGPKTVTLIIYYNNCSDTVIRTAYINVTTPVNFTFSGSPVSSCSPPLTVNFTSNAPGAISYLWDFGDGNTSTAQNPSEPYTARGSYTVTLKITNAQGCVNTKADSNYISIADIHAGFTVDTPGGCAPVIAHFTSTSTSNPAITNYYWDFGDTTAPGGNSANVTHTYTKQGQFTAMLIVTNASGCTDTFRYTPVIKIGSKLIPDFIATPLTQCVDQPVIFTDTTQGESINTQFRWLFGDGGTSALRDPTHAYRDTGTYDITLTIINQGCKSDTVRLKYVDIIVPKADFYFKTSCANATTIAFIDSSIGADSWLWSFGDGSPTTTAQDPTHTFPADGTYKIKLTVTNNTTGCVDSTTKTIQVGVAQASFISDTTSGCYPLKINFKDTSSTSSTWKWSFGDGHVGNTKTPAYTYADTGTYSVTLVVTTAGGCRDSITKVNYIKVYGVKASYGIAPPIGCVPLSTVFLDSSTSYGGTLTSWRWQFGTGAADTSILKAPTHIYDTLGTFTTQLKVKDSHGCSATATRIVKTVQPIASFRSDTAACPGEPVQFTNTSLNADTYTWFFGDGGTSSQFSPTYVYTHSGHFAVTLIAINTQTGCADTVVEPNYMNIDSPVVDFYPSSTFSPCPPFPVQFYNMTTRPNLQYSWTFGDGGSANTYDPLHVYFFPGDYNVTLTAKDTNGCAASKTYIDLVRVRGPKGNFHVTPDTGCVPLTIAVTGSAQSTVHIIADLGDGPTYEDTINLIHTYTVPGTYYPVYTLSDSLGCVVAYPIDTIVVGLIPYPNLPPDTLVCKGNYIQFNLPYGDHFQWTSNLGTTYLTCDTCQNTISQSPDTITYYVTAITNIGCVAKDTILMNVDALPQIQPGLFYRICVNDTLQLSAGTNVSAATWTPDQYISDTTLVNPKVWPPDSTTYRVTASNSAGCAISRIVKVYPIHNVYGGLSVHDTILCEGYPIQLLAHVTEASYNDTFYRWTPTDYLNSPTISDPMFTPPLTTGSYNFQVIISSEHCTPDTDNVHIVVAPVPVLEAGDNQTVSEGTPIQIYANSQDNVTYQWTPGFDSLSCLTCRRPSLDATKTEVIYVSVVNEFGCTATDSVLIRVVSCDDKVIFVPNTFTPNGDGVNDKLYVRGIGLRKLENFRIFDRWGRMVWQTNNIEEGWDGIISGKLADVATYVYMVQGVCTSGSAVEKSGNVTLIR